MRVFIYFVLVFGIVASSFAQEIVVKQVDGNVEFVVGEKRTIVKDFSTFYEKEGVFILKDKNSQLFIRIGDKLDILTFSEDKYKYLLIDLITKKKEFHKQDEEGFLNKFFNMFSVSHDDDTKINGMLVAEKSGVSRSFNDTNIVFIEEIMMIDGYPLKIDFTNFTDSDNNKNNEFNILVKNKWSNRIIKKEQINETYFTIKTDSENSLVTYWVLEINNINSSEKIKGTIKSLPLNSNKRNLFDQLKDKAIAESKTDECSYQIIFIESLRSSGLLVNASYFLDLFIETNNNPRLINYKNYYSNK